MTTRKTNVPYYVMIGLTVIAAVWGGVRFGKDIPWDRWLELGLFTALTSYFYTRSVDIGSRMSYSIGSSVVFPVIYLYGSGAAILISAIAGAVDALAHKKSWDRSAFNIAQLSLCCVVGGLVFSGLRGYYGAPFHLADILWMTIAGAVYIALNVVLVTLAGSVFLRASWWSRLQRIGRSGFFNNAVSGYIGLVFTLFVAEFELWGVVLFGFLLIQFSELLHVGVSMSLERNLRRELEQELVIDSKTQVYNFRYLNEWLADPTNGSIAVLFIDIDDFKLFNDIYGHDEGDRVLTVLADTITRSVRQDDKVIRYGGEEFVVLLPNMTREGAKKAAERIQTALSQLSCANRKHPVTVSIGIAACPQDAEDKHQLLRLADAAMYEAKSSGKNCCFVWESKSAILAD